jgi:hypothetical protein
MDRNGRVRYGGQKSKFLRSQQDKDFVGNLYDSGQERNFYDDGNDRDSGQCGQFQ